MPNRPRHIIEPVNPERLSVDIFSTVTPERSESGMGFMAPESDGTQVPVIILRLFVKSMANRLMKSQFAEAVGLDQERSVTLAIDPYQAAAIIGQMLTAFHYSGKVTPDELIAMSRQAHKDMRDSHLGKHPMACGRCLSNWMIEIPPGTGDDELVDLIEKAIAAHVAESPQCQ